MNKGILLFDIDRTIFDTSKMADFIDQEILKIVGVSNEEKMKQVDEEYSKSLKRDREYSPEEHLRLLAKECGLESDKELLEVYFGDKFSYVYKDSVYPETFKILEALKNHFRLGIYSEGNIKFQNNKFKSMDISEYFEENLIFIVPAKDSVEVLNNIPKEAIVVDDKEIICDFLSQNRMRAIWINRKDKRKSKKFDTIHNLLALVPKLM